MILTERAAAARWCPLTGIMFGGKNGGSRCIGSDCMLWRVASATPLQGTGTPPVFEYTGYCGLGGKP
jgi:hypothetical protein